ncbi:MAG: DUF882 domain-containing protein [Alphaproteobacteria bacterium]|nr:DUF882 domain-containing protein [Alphaproteobacteria bacterium]MBQ3946369.1 DUF882 domain-containing protein [Alphaproteobacteria bacterium]
MNLQNKFQCHYKLILQWPEDNGQLGQAIVTDPITINFDIKKELFQSTNTAKITIYNLDGGTRESIYQDRLLFETTRQKSVTLLAGYGNTLTLCLFGHIQQCYSERVGTDMVTTIDVIDPDILTQYTSVTFEAGTTFREAIDYLTSQFPDLKQGEVGNFEGEFKTPTVFDGNSFNAINELTGGHTYIDNGVLNSLNDNEVLSNYGAYLIQSDTGLLGTPKRYEAVLEIEMLFEPDIRLGQMVEIVSETQSRFSGQYKVVGLNHNCTISGATGGTRTTKLQLLYVKYLTNSNVNLTSNPTGSNASFIINGKATPIDSKITGEISEVYDYIKKNNGNIPKKMANKLVSWKDLIGHNNSPDERLAEITKEKLANCKATADRLLDFVNKYFPGKKLSVTSGWRSTANNAREGGVDNSQHLYGRAIDFVIKGVTPSKVYATAASSNMFKGIGKYSTFTHVDVRK